MGSSLTIPRYVTFLKLNCKRAETEKKKNQICHLKSMICHKQNLPLTSMTSLWYILLFCICIVLFCFVWLGLHSGVSSSGLQSEYVYCTFNDYHYKTNSNKDLNVEVLDTKAVRSPAETAFKFKVCQWQSQKTILYSQMYVRMEILKITFLQREY